MPDVIGTLFHKDIPYGGVKGDKGDTGATPNVSATASVNSSTGTPSVNVVKTGTAENPSFKFEFSNLKGEKGDPGSGSSVSWGEIYGDIADQTDLSTELGKKYDENDTAETDIADDDYVPFYDTSATGKRKSLWSNIKAKLKAYFDGIYTLLTIVGTVESGTTASKRYEIGNHFIKDGYFCTATAAIAQGATFTLNTNYTQGDIADACKAVVARTGSYNDLSNKPTIPTVNNAKLTIQRNGTTVKTFTANASSDVTCNIQSSAIKSGTASGTTDSAGDLQLYNGSRFVFIVDVVTPSTGVIAVSPFIYDNRTFCTFLASNNHSPKTGTAVKVTYYYLE